VTPKEELQALLTEAGIVHFTAHEFCSVRSIRHVEVPPRELWPNILPCARLCDQLRERVGHPLVLLGGYRSPTINRRVGGAMRSQHRKFRAADLGLPRDLDDDGHRRLLYVEATKLWLETDEQMGLGLYRRDAGPRVHIDGGWKQRYWKRRHVRRILAQLQRGDLV
jgi:hypothetical protein